MQWLRCSVQVISKIFVLQQQKLQWVWTVDVRVTARDYKSGVVVSGSLLIIRAPDFPSRDRTLVEPSFQTSLRYCYLSVSEGICHCMCTVALITVSWHIRFCCWHEAHTEDFPLSYGQAANATYVHVRPETNVWNLIHLRLLGFGWFVFWFNERKSNWGIIPCAAWNRFPAVLGIVVYGKQKR